MVNTDKHICLSDLTIQLVKFGKAMDTLVEFSRSSSLSIYQIIDKRLSELNSLLSDQDSEVDEICKNLIIKFNHIKSLQKSNDNSDQLKNMLNSIYDDIVFQKEKLQAIIQNLKRKQKRVTTDKAITKTPYPSIDELLDNETIKNIPKQNDLEFKYLSLISLYELQLQLHSKVKSGFNETGLILNSILEYFTILDLQLNRIYMEFQTSRQRVLTISLIYLNDFVKQLQKTKHVSVDKKLKIFENGILTFLEKSKIKIMDTNIGDMVNLENHRIIRQVPYEAIGNPKDYIQKKNTIIEIQSIGFLKGGVPFYPAQVNIQV